MSSASFRTSTARRKQRLSLEKQRLDTAVNNMTQGLLLFDSKQQLVICNDRYREMYGLSDDVVKPGCSFREVIAHRKETGSFVGDVDHYVEVVLRDIAHRNVMVISTPDGRSIQVVNEPVPDGGWLATHEDITERRRAEERITHLAHYDALTDLPNRTLFHERLKRELSHAAPDRQLAVLYIDIDEFKSVNDSLGHMIGDELLKSVAASLAACARKTDFVARLGGDEFAIVQTGIDDTDDVMKLVSRIFGSIRSPYQCLGHQVTTDASIGIALAPQDGSDIDQILKNADLAMYAAKAAGRRTYRFFEADMEAEVRARRSLEMDLRQALVDGGFEVYYQPFLSLQTNAITGCEALVRWRHPQRGMISPAEFVPLAEDTGLINQLGEWVLTSACKEAVTWPGNIRLAVNVSPVQFRSGTLPLKVMAALAASGLAASRLELEITEAVLISDDEAALAVLHDLRAIGVRIALDDFGTGYSSLSYLQRFPFDKIKIDRCFITDIAEPEGSSSIVQAVVTIAADRHMTTTAEGVETEEQRELLRELGCSEMQGYLFSPPKPAAEIRPLLFADRQGPDAVQPSRARRRKPVAGTLTWLRPPPPHFRIASAFRGGPIRWLILGGALLIAAIAIGATFMAGNFRERALRNSERELENTVLLLARHFDQQLEDFQVVQKDLIEFMRSSGIATVENYKPRMSSHDIHLMLKSKIDALSYVGGVNIFDADGNLINASAVWPAPPVNSADRAFFRTFKSNPQSPEMLVEPVYSRVTGAWTTVIARKVTGPKGEFVGVIGRGIEPVNFEKFLSQP